MRSALAALLLFALAACQREAPAPVNPALWEVTGPAGQKGWLFGTVHALAEPLNWQTERIMAPLATADRLVVEVAGLDDAKGMTATFAALATTPGQPPLNERVVAAQRPALDALLDRSRLRADQFAAVETWAAALTLARASTPEQNPGLGVDRALLDLARGKRVEELEGAEAQLRIFDALPEADQRDLLAASVAEADESPRSEELAKAWSRGDMILIEAETRRGLLADPELRAALLVNRNRAWTERIDAMLRGGARPFVAVGAAHLAGNDGLPAMLATRGYTVRRIQ